MCSFGAEMTIERCKRITLLTLSVAEVIATSKDLMSSRCCVRWLTRPNAPMVYENKKARFERVFLFSSSSCELYLDQKFVI